MYSAMHVIPDITFKNFCSLREEEKLPWCRWYWTGRVIEFEESVPCKIWVGQLENSDCQVKNCFILLLYHGFSEPYSWKHSENFLCYQLWRWLVFTMIQCHWWQSKTPSHGWNKSTNTSDVLFQSTIYKENPTSKPMLTVPSDKVLRICLGNFH